MDGWLVQWKGSDTFHTSLLDSHTLTGQTVLRLGRLQSPIQGCTFPGDNGEALKGANSSSAQKQHSGYELCVRWKSKELEGNGSLRPQRLQSGVNHLLLQSAMLKSKVWWKIKSAQEAVSCARAVCVTSFSYKPEEVFKLLLKLIWLCSVCSPKWATQRYKFWTMCSGWNKTDHLRVDTELIKSSITNITFIRDI